MNYFDRFPDVRDLMILTLKKPLKQKHHFMVHYARIMSAIGPYKRLVYAF